MESELINKRAVTKTLSYILIGIVVIMGLIAGNGYAKGVDLGRDLNIVAPGAIKEVALMSNDLQCNLSDFERAGFESTLTLKEQQIFDKFSCKF